jgi:hypothetical protein
MILLVLSLLTNMPVVASSGETHLISVDSDEVQANGFSLFAASVSLEGRYVLFLSNASNLVPNDLNATTDDFLRDTLNGETSLISVNTAGQSGNGMSTSAMMTTDGRYVVFQSAASDLVENDTNGVSGIFFRDLQTNTTLLLSVTSQLHQQHTHVHITAETSDNRHGIAVCKSALTTAAGK